MKEWTVEVYILDEAGKEKPARCFQKVVYNLHPSFENPVQSESFLHIRRPREPERLGLGPRKATQSRQLTDRLQLFMSRPSSAQTRAGASSR